MYGLLWPWEEGMGVFVVCSSVTTCRECGVFGSLISCLCNNCHIAKGNCSEILLVFYFLQSQS